MAERTAYVYLRSADGQLHAYGPEDTLPGEENSREGESEEAPSRTTRKRAARKTEDNPKE